ncbi:alpha/beta hydrolase [Rhodalgimonas zhirmunskyi]|uniref:alpha/beta hydrolase n=1 Tax=Rhodalgimonas zhirmunskyi TaxID=2964767 RepID=UPI002952944E|nr:alpha/beta fold hydrolase [Rhodoalgimonas zhirmunskyi]
MKLVVFAGISLLIFFAIALGLIVSQPAKGVKSAAQTLVFERIMGAGDVAPLPRVEVLASDGARYEVAHLAAPDKPLLVMLHGSGWHGGQFTRLARALEGAAEIVIPSLRGHYQGPGERGDIAHMGQLEDDIAALIRARAAPGQKVVLLGHSSGGGLVVRFAGGAHGGLIDRAILLAPFLQYDAPTTRANSGGWAHPLTRRIIGLSMLNMVGIHALDGLTAMEFAMPDAVLNGPLGDQATLAYSWRLNQSYAPRRDYLGDISALPPFLLIAGAEDEAFVAEGYAPLMTPASPNGRFEVIAGRGHLDIVDAPETVALIKDVLP